jgi:hypothetical protein
MSKLEDKLIQSINKPAAKKPVAKKPVARQLPKKRQLKKHLLRKSQHLLQSLKFKLLQHLM